MALRVIIHVHNDDPFVAEMDELPKPEDNFVVVRNPRLRDGKALTYVTDGATAFIFPWNRITFIEVMDGSTTKDSVVGFFREDNRPTY